MARKLDRVGGDLEAAELLAGLELRHKAGQRERARRREQLEEVHKQRRLQLTCLVLPSDVRKACEEGLHLVARRERRDLEAALFTQHGPPEPIEAVEGQTPCSPRLALLRRDQDSQRYWDRIAALGDDREFLAWIAEAKKPYGKRQHGVPDYDELQDIATVRSRIHAIAIGDNRELRDQLRAILVPTRIGPPRKVFDRTDVARARELRVRLQPEIRRIKRQTGCAIATDRMLAIRELLDRMLLDWTASDRQEMAELIERPSMPASEAAARIAGRKFHIHWDMVRRRGWGPRSGARPPLSTDSYNVLPFSPDR